MFNAFEFWVMLEQISFESIYWKKQTELILRNSKIYLPWFIISCLCSSPYCIKSANHAGELKSSLLTMTESLMAARAFSFLRFDSFWHACCVWQSTACLVLILLGKTTKSSQLEVHFLPIWYSTAFPQLLVPQGSVLGPLTLSAAVLSNHIVSLSSVMPTTLNSRSYNLPPFPLSS